MDAEKMIKKVIIIFAVIILAGIASAQDVSSILNKVNNNSQYLEFIADSGYDSARVSIGDADYYIVYDGKLKLSEKTKYDFSIKLTKEEFERRDKKALFKKLPFNVKVDVFFQCVATKWCRELL